MVPEEERMEVLSALWFVDYVTSYDDATADRILLLLRPDAYTKGTDYQGKPLPEKDSLKELGLKPVFVGDKKAHSSTKLIQKIRKKKFD